jgi:hypothetical protein
MKNKSFPLTKTLSKGWWMKARKHILEIKFKSCRSLLKSFSELLMKSIFDDFFMTLKWVIRFYARSLCPTPLGIYVLIIS